MEIYGEVALKPGEDIEFQTGAHVAVHALSKGPGEGRVTVTHASGTGPTLVGSNSGSTVSTDHRQAGMTTVKNVSETATVVIGFFR